MRRLRQVLCGMFVVAVLGLCMGTRPFLSWAEIHLEPTMMVEEEHTDNFFRTETDKTSMFITRVAPGINFQALTERSRVDLTYVFSYYWYNSPSAKFDAASYNYAGQDLNLFASTQLYSRLKLGLLESYLLTREPAYLDTFTQIVTNSKYWRNRISPSLAYDISEKGEASLAFRNELLNYLTKIRPPGEEDSYENRGILTLTYNFNTKHHLDLETQVWNRNYSGNINSEYNAYQSMLIFRREFSSTFDGQIGAGYQFREFFQSSYGNVGLFAFLVRLNGTTENSKISLAVERNFNDFTNYDDYFSAYLLRVAGEHLFLGKIRTYLGGFYQFGSYIDSPRRDGIWNLVGGVGYLFWDKRLELSVEYNYTNRNSNQVGAGYAENQIYFRLRAHHDFASK
jgi:hypothetical protein